MAMVVVVPGEELLAEGAAVLNTAKAIRKTGPVLQGAKLAFRVRVVVRNIRTAVRLGDAQVGHQERHWFGAHNLPRSAWMVSWSGGISCFCKVSSMKYLASSADSRSAAIQPVT